MFTQYMKCSTTYVLMLTHLFSTPVIVLLTIIHTLFFHFHIVQIMGTSNFLLITIRIGEMFYNWFYGPLMDGKATGRNQKHISQNLTLQKHISMNFTVDE